MDKKSVGMVGENYAAQYLISREYTIINRNWTCRWGEIDIIAQKDEKLVFVEVKYRTSDKFGKPVQAVTAKKLKSLKNSIWRYLLIYEQFHRECRLDVVSIYPKKGKYRLKHYKSVTF